MDPQELGKMLWLQSDDEKECQAYVPDSASGVWKLQRNNKRFTYVFKDLAKRISGAVLHRCRNTLKRITSINSASAQNAADELKRHIEMVSSVIDKITAGGSTCEELIRSIINDRTRETEQWELTPRSWTAMRNMHASLSHMVYMI